MRELNVTYTLTVDPNLRTRKEANFEKPEDLINALNSLLIVTPPRFGTAKIAVNISGENVYSFGPPYKSEAV